MRISLIYVRMARIIHMLLQQVFQIRIIFLQHAVLRHVPYQRTFLFIFLIFLFLYFYLLFLSFFSLFLFFSLFFFFSFFLFWNRTKNTVLEGQSFTIKLRERINLTRTCCT